VRGRRARVVGIVVAALVVAAGVFLLTRGGDGQKHTESASGAEATGPATTTAVPGKARPAKEKANARRAPRGLEIGLQDDAVFTSRAYYDADQGFRQARKLGVSWLRITVPWAAVVESVARRKARPAAIPWHWAQYDAAVDAARAHGLRVEMALTGPAPAWATSNKREGAWRPSPSEFAGFAHAAAEHFRGRVKRYGIWNEPNLIAWLRPVEVAPLLYRRLYQAGHPAIKQADPKAAVLIGETAPFAAPGKGMAPLAFLRGLACTGCAPLVADGYAHHPYAFTTAPDVGYPGPDNVSIGSIDRLTATLDNLAARKLVVDPHGRALDIYLTEFGYFARGDRSLPAATRAQYLSRSFAIAAQRYPRVRQLLQYLLVSPVPGLPGGRFDTSLVTQSGAPSPAFTSLAAWARGAIAQRRALPPGRPPRHN
jgi:hypothetical protein